MLPNCPAHSNFPIEAHADTAKQLFALDRRAWTGMQGIFFTESQLSAMFNLDLPGGLLLQSVAKGSPADKAGLRAGTIAIEIASRQILLGGDLIQKLGNQDACHSECLISAHERLLAEDSISVAFLRGGKLLQTTLDVKDTRKSFLPKATLRPNTDGVRDDAANSLPTGK